MQQNEICVFVYDVQHYVYVVVGVCLLLFS